MLCRTMKHNDSAAGDSEHLLQAEMNDWTFQTTTTTEDRVLQWMWRIAAPTLLTVGTLGNLFGLVILTVTPAFRGRRGGAVGFALSALCCVDIGVLMTSLIRRCLLHWSGFDVSASSSVACRAHFFLVHLFSQLSSSTVAILSADRAVIVWRSVPAAGLYGRRRMAIVWTSVLLVLCAVNLHFFWTAQHITASSPIADVNNRPSQIGFDVTDDHNTEASTVCYNSSSQQTTASDIPFHKTASQTTFSLSLPFFTLSEKPAVLGTSLSSIKCLSYWVC